MEFGVAAPEVLLLADLPLDAIGLVLCRLPRAHDIARVAKASRSLKLAADLAFTARPFTGKVLTLGGHDIVSCVAAADDGHVLTGSEDYARVWRGDELVGSTEAHTNDRVDGYIYAVAVLPGSARFISGSHDKTAKLFTFGGEL